MNAEPIDADFEEKSATGTSLVPAQTAQPVTPWTPRFTTSVDDAIAWNNERKRYIESVLEKDVHYGVIPGTDKPALLKPGAESLLAAMSLTKELVDEDEPTIDYGDVTIDGKVKREGTIRYRRQCLIYRITEDGRKILVAKASGSCTSREKKYRFRNDRLKCPQCEKATIIKAKDFSDQGRDLGWVCWKKEGKSDGCGAKFNPGDPAIASQVVGKILNPDIADLENTILKIADKRALVASTLLATGCSDVFTQDVEDSAEMEGGGESAAAAGQPPATPPAPPSEPLPDLITPEQVKEIAYLFTELEASKDERVKTMLRHKVAAVRGKDGAPVPSRETPRKCAASLIRELRGEKSATEIAL